MAFAGVTFTEEKREFEIFGTVNPAKDFDAEKDAQNLYIATRVNGMDKEVIIHFVSRRSTEQLNAIAVKFKETFGKDLVEVLGSELKGNFRKVVLGRFYEKYDYQAYILRTAMKGLGTDEQALIDVVCSKTSEEMKKIKQAYQTMFKRDLIDDIKSETSGHLGRILVTMASAIRETKEVDMVEAKREAQELYKAGEGKWGTDEKVFNRIFATRSPMQLKLTFLLYRKLAGKLIFEVVDSEMSGKLKSAFLTIAQYIKDPTTYYSEVMFDSMKGIGTSNDRLIRTIVARCEIDLKTVKERYNKLHEQQAPLAKRISKKTKGDYMKILLSLIQDKVEVVK